MRRVVIALTILLTLVISSCGGGGGPTVPVDDLVQAGNAAMLSGNGTEAEQNYTQALAASPTNPDANFGMAFIELMVLANDLVMFLSSSNEELFHNVSWFAMAPVMGFPYEQANIGGIERMLGDYEEPDVDDMTIEQIRLEVESILGPLESIAGYLDVVLANAGDTWSFTIPEDWNDPTAGTITIIKADVYAISAMFNTLLGVLHLSVAYSPGPLGIHTNEFGEIEITGISGESPDMYVDTNLDTYITLDEIADQEGLPGGLGVLAVGGSAHLNNSVSRFRQGFTHARDATESYINLSNPHTHWALDDVEPGQFIDFIASWNSYGRDYANDLIAAFTGTTTLGFYPGHIAEYPEVDDELGAGYTVRVNFAWFISHLPNDLRDFPVRFVYDAFDELVLPDTVGAAFSDTTILGLVPDGMDQALFDVLYE